MNAKDMKFLQAYVALDDVCKKRLRAEKGITQYIDQLSDKDRTSEELKTLRSLRYKRNKLVHEVNADVAPTSQEIKWLTDFKEKVENKKDPLSVLERKSAKKRSPSENKRKRSKRKAKSKNGSRPAVNGIAAAFAICAAIVILTAVIIHFFF